MKKTYLSLALLFFSPYSIAGPLYFGGGLGKVDYDADYISSFDNPVSVELIAGLNMNNNLAFEASYIDFGEANDGIFPNWRLSATGLTMGALFKMPVSVYTDLFFKLGMNSWEQEISEDGFGVFAERDGNDVFYGIGASTKINNMMSVDARFNMYDFDGDDVTMFSINLLVGL